jgi:hypothetical protein
MVPVDETFKIICAPEQMDRMQRVIAHNGGVGEIVRAEPDAVYVVIRKLPSGGGE